MDGKGGGDVSQWRREREKNLDKGYLFKTVDKLKNEKKNLN